MAGKFIRNPLPWPPIEHEELLSKPIALAGCKYDWTRKVSLSDRLYNHNTLASIRWHRTLKSPCAPKDSLDFMLTSIYDHTQDTFAEPNFVYMQPDNVGLPTYKLLRNVRFIPTIRPADDQPEEDGSFKESYSLRPGTKWYGIKLGGIEQRVDVFNVKLGLSAYHGPQSNAGFSRKVDGSYYGS